MNYSWMRSELFTEISRETLIRPNASSGESLYQDENQAGLGALTSSLTAIYAASVQEWIQGRTAMIYQRHDVERAGYGVVFLLTILVMMGSHSAVVRGAPPQEAVIEGGGAESPPGGGRPDAQTPQLGTGNRATGQRGSAGASSVDPSKVRSEVTGPGRVIGQVLMIDGDSYVIRDKQGHELTFRIDRSTAVEGLINMGAKVAADVEADGRVSRLELVQ